MKDAGRDRSSPFVVRVEGPWARRHPRACRHRCFGHDRDAGSARRLGRPAIGEWRRRASILYGIPDVLGTSSAALRRPRVLVVGSGHSALNALLDLAGSPRRRPRPESSGRSGGRRSGICSEAGAGPARRTRPAGRRACGSLLDGGVRAGDRLQRRPRRYDDGRRLVVQRRRTSVRRSTRSLPRRASGPTGRSFGVRLDLDPVGRESARAGAPDRSECPQLRHRAAARGGGAAAPGARISSSSA